MPDAYPSCPSSCASSPPRRRRGRICTKARSRSPSCARRHKACNHRLHGRLTRCSGALPSRAPDPPAAPAALLGRGRGRRWRQRCCVAPAPLLPLTPPRRWPSSPRSSASSARPSPWPWKPRPRGTRAARPSMPALPWKPRPRAPTSHRRRTPPPARTPPTSHHKQTSAQHMSRQSRSNRSSNLTLQRTPAAWASQATHLPKPDHRLLVS
mmetsp:Transcript_5450/g.20660  ORF Transcript_5450/g.20660 Transcript_5450/m.20660 type:complete len:210 (-) Transcript_5450:369-998(-)